MKIRSLTGRVAFLMGIAIVLVLGTAAKLMDHMVDARMEQRFDSGLLTQARILESLIDTGPGGIEFEKAAGPQLQLRRGHLPAMWAVACADGNQAASDPPPLGYPSGWSTSDNTQPTISNLNVRGHALRAVWFRFVANDDVHGHTMDKGVCRLVFMRSRAELDDILTAIDIILFVVPALALLLVLVLSPFLVRKGLAPLSALGDGMRAIGPRASGNRLSTTGVRELDPLVARFNEVLARMDEGISRERGFAGALAHETRTKLAELRTLIEVEQRYPGSRPLSVLLADIGNISVELGNMVSSLLLLTRLDADIQDMQWAHVDVERALRRSMEHLDTLCEQRRLRWQRLGDTVGVRVFADPSLLDVILDNVLGNACAYSPAGATLQLEAAQTGITISNPTTDLVREEVAAFGQRFWSKHHGSDGHAGLGLALAGAAARAMGMTLVFSLDDAHWMHVRIAWQDSGSKGSSNAISS